MSVKYFILFAILICTKVTVGQSQAEEIQRLQKLAKENEERAIKAEALAERNLDFATYVEKEAKRMEYLRAADNLALSSNPIPDKELSALLAIQAYNFNMNNEGYNFNSKMYDALYSALKKYERLPDKLPARGIHSIVSNSNSIFSIGNDGKVVRWIKQNDEWKGKDLSKININGIIQAVDLNEEGNLIAIGTANSANSKTSYVQLLNIEGQIKKVEGFTSKISKIIFTPDGKGFYALCNSGQSIMYSDFNVAKEVITSKETMLSIDISPSGNKLVGSSSLGNLFVWDTSTYSSLVYKIINDGSLNYVAFLSKNKDLIVGGKSGELRLISVNNGQILRIFYGHTSTVDQIQFSHSGKFMATLGSDNTIRIWNLSKMSEWPIVIKNSSVTSFTFSPDDTQVLSVSDFNINIWSLQAKEMADELCTLVKRNLTAEEWEMYASQLRYEKTCR